MDMPVEIHTESQTGDGLLDGRILGHDLVQRGLLRAMSTGRLAHAHLFTGPDGIGKKLVALALAKALVCPNAGGNKGPCLACRQCEMVELGVHPDVRVFVRDKVTFSTELMRDVILDWASRRPREGRNKIGILNDVEHLGVQSANAFLKTLEEPPNGTSWILLTSDPAATLTTIRSRCQSTAFQPLSTEEMETLLQGALGSALREAAREAAGRGGKSAAKGKASMRRTSAKKPSGFGDFTRGEDDEPDEHEPEDEDAADFLTPQERSFAVGMAQGSPGAAIASVREGYVQVRELLLSRIQAGMAWEAGAGGARGVVQGRPAGWGTQAKPESLGPIDAGEALATMLAREDEETQEGLRVRMATAIGMAEGLIRDLLVLKAGGSVALFNRDAVRALAAINDSPVAPGIPALQGGLERMAMLRRAVIGNTGPKTVAASLMLELEGLFGE
jgi:DNA polymerase III delta' subunit